MENGIAPYRGGMAEPTEGSTGRSRAPRGAVRARMVDGALRLLATKGVEGTSFAEVLQATDSPRGSVYHHFPGGKEELLHAALDLSSERGLAAMEATRGQPPKAVIQCFLAIWRDLLSQYNLSAGCAVVAVTVSETDDGLRDHAGRIFRNWSELLADLCETGGMDEGAARRIAVTVIAAVEGAVVMSRAERSKEPFDAVESVLVALVEGSGDRSTS